jgi:hypothetical protein
MFFGRTVVIEDEVKRMRNLLAGLFVVGWISTLSSQATAQSSRSEPLTDTSRDVSIALTHCYPIVRKVASSVGGVVQVEDFGARGDGISDDSEAFSAALASGASVVQAFGGSYKTSSVIVIGKGQTLQYGPGSHLTAGILFTDSTTDQTGIGQLICEGSGVSTLTLLTGSNRDIVSQVNFATLTGTNSPYGLFHGRIAGCTLDGNKTGQTKASYAIRLYGHGLNFNDLILQNAKSSGIYTEWCADSTFAGPQDDLEGLFNNIKSIFNDGDGWTFRGPHDSDFVNLVLCQNGGWGLQVQYLANAYNGNGHFSNLNTYLNSLGGIYSNSSFDGSQVAGTTAAGWGMLIDSGSGAHNISSATFAGPIGVEVKAPSQNITGVIANTTVSALKLNGGSGMFSLQMFNNIGYQLDFTSEVGPSTISVNSANAPPGPLFKGAPSSSDYVIVEFGGPSGNNRYVSFPAGR